LKNEKYQVKEESKGTPEFSLSSDEDPTGVSPNLLKDLRFLDLEDDNQQLRDKPKKQPKILLTALSTNLDE
jgi:hypothetical protein